MLAGQRAIFPDTAENALKEEFFGARTGYFVDVGANDPEGMSQNWHLGRLGWRAASLSNRSRSRRSLIIRPTSTWSHIPLRTSNQIIPSEP